MEEEAATFHLLTNGSLRGSFPGQNVSRVQLWERSLPPFLENERGRVDTSLRNKSRNKLRSTCFRVEPSSQ